VTGVYSEKNSSVRIINSILWNDGRELEGDGFDVSFSVVRGGFAGEGNIDEDPMFVNANNPKGSDGMWGTLDDGLIIKENKRVVYQDVEMDMLQRYRNRNTPTIGAYEFLPRQANTAVFGRMNDGAFFEAGDITYLYKIVHQKEVYWYSRSRLARVIRMYVENNKHTRGKQQIEITFNSLDENGRVINRGIKMQIHRVNEENPNGLLVFQTLSSDYSKGKQVLFVGTPEWHGWQNDWAYIIQVNDPFSYRIDVDNRQFR
jgi:hypothetical protein